jgi:hypothetical protein
MDWDQPSDPRGAGITDEGQEVMKGIQGNPASGCRFTRGEQLNITRRPSSSQSESEPQGGELKAPLSSHSSANVPSRHPECNGDTDPSECADA